MELNNIFFKIKYQKKINYFLMLIVFLLSIQFIFAQNAEEYFNLANQNYKEQNYNEAIKNYEKSLQINPNFAKANHNLGNVYYLLGDSKKAIKYYNLSIQNAPNESSPYVSRGLLYLDLKKVTEAEDDAKRALSVKPDSPDAHFLLGNIRNFQNKKEEACKFWKMAAGKGHPQANELIQNKCNSNIVNNQKKENQKKENEKKSISAKDFIKSGEIKLEKRDYKNALLDFEKAIELDNKNGQAYFGIGGAKFAEGEEEEACKAWRKALELGYKKAKEMLKGVCSE